MQNNKPYILAIDRGQTNIKAAVCTGDGKVISVSSAACKPLRHLHPGWADQDMDDIREQAFAAIRKVFENGEILPGQIGAVSFSGQGGGCFLLSKEGTAIYPGVVSMDKRHEEILSKIEQRDKLRMARTPLFLRWLKENEPEIFADTEYVFGSKDWIRFCLTGKANVDYTDLPAPYNFQTGEYDPEVFELAGVPECVKMLPPAVTSGSFCGTVTKEAALQTGLAEGTPVVAGAHDMMACSAGAGGRRNAGHVVIILGTMAINVAVVPEEIGPEEIRKARMYCAPGVAPGVRVMTSSIGLGCAVQDWYLNQLFSQETAQAEAEGMDAHAYIEKLLSDRSVTDILFLPYLSGSLENADARSCFMGISARHSRIDFLRALYQGIAISQCIELRRLESFLGKMTDVWIVGGGAKSDIWGQMFADILNTEVKIPQTEEVGCVGAAICAAMAMGEYDFDEAPLPKAGKIWKPDQERWKLYAAQIPLYEKAKQLSFELEKCRHNAND